MNVERQEAILYPDCDYQFNSSKPQVQLSPLKSFIYNVTLVVRCLIPQGMSLNSGPAAKIS